MVHSPSPALPPLFEVVHTLGLPAMAAIDTFNNVRLTLVLVLWFSIPLPISYLTAPSFRFSVIVNLRTTHFITYSGL